MKNNYAKILAAYWGDPTDYAKLAEQQNKKLQAKAAKIKSEKSLHNKNN